jgi:hypothetical protein
MEIIIIIIIIITLVCLCLSLSGNSFYFFPHSPSATIPSINKEEKINETKLDKIEIEHKKAVEADKLETDKVLLNNTELTMEDSIKKKNIQEILDLNKKLKEELLIPNYNPSDMRILYDCSNEKSNLNIQPNDIIIAPNLFCEQNNFDIYKKLLEEIEQCGIDKNKLWKLWHGDKHVIADDNINWSDKNVPTFNMIIDKISKFFNMNIKATRFNFYRDNNDWKPFHHDSDVPPDKENMQNFTVGVSFGSTREIAFEDAFEDVGHRRIISLPLPNGSTYCFTRDININWKHGLLPIDPNKNIPNKLGRISIIAWGYIDHKEVK